MQSKVLSALLHPFLTTPPLPPQNPPNGLSDRAAAAWQAFRTLSMQVSNRVQDDPNFDPDVDTVSGWPVVRSMVAYPRPHRTAREIQPSSIMRQG